MPFFLVGGTALGLGRGDDIYPLADLPPTSLVIVRPQFGVSTAEAYGWYDNEPKPKLREGVRRERPAGWPDLRCVVRPPPRRYGDAVILETIVGTTYMASDVHRQFLFEPNPHVWDRDFAQMKSLGINMVRTGLWTAWSRAIDAKGVPNEAFLRSLDAYVHSAAKHGVLVNFTFYAFLPPAHGGTNPYLDPKSLDGQKNFLTAVASRYRGPAGTTAPDEDSLSVTPMTARPGSALSGSARLPGDKSISHRALILNAIASGNATVESLLESDDVRSTAACLRAMRSFTLPDGRARTPRLVDRRHVGRQELVQALHRSGRGILRLLTLGCEHGGTIPAASAYVVPCSRRSSSTTD